ncbi:MAG: hypothetical protein AB7K67_08355 [Hyphomicrobiaceae bacterium]|jgi:hypothetical protein
MTKKLVLGALAAMIAGSAAAVPAAEAHPRRVVVRVGPVYAYGGPYRYYRHHPRYFVRYAWAPSCAYGFWTWRHGYRRFVCTSWF